MTINTSAFGGGGIPKLGADLTWPSVSDAAGGVPSVTFDPSGGLTTALSLTGKFAISWLELFGLTNSETYTVKLTVDGVVIWNDTFAHGSGNIYLLGTASNANPEIPISCNSTFLLEVQSAVDTSVSLRYKVRPIV